jgi:hypothetical protein
MRYEVWRGIVGVQDDDQRVGVAMIMKMLQNARQDAE